MAKMESAIDFEMKLECWQSGLHSHSSGVESHADVGNPGFTDYRNPIASLNSTISPAPSSFRKISGAANSPSGMLAMAAGLS